MYTVLAFIHAPGCHACHAARPEWEKFKRLHAAELGVLTVDIDATAEEFPELSVTNWSPERTPSYLLRIGTRGFVLEGGLPTKAIVKWVKAKLALVEQSMWPTSSTSAQGGRR